MVMVVDVAADLHVIPVKPTPTDNNNNDDDGGRG